MKASSRFTLKGLRCSFLPLLLKNVKNINVTEFKDINTVNLTRKVSARASAIFLIHWTVFLNKISQYFKVKMIDFISFDYSAFLTNKQVRLKKKTQLKNYQMQQQQVKTGLSFSEIKKQNTMILNLKNVERWVNLKTILLTWHESKKKSIQMTIDIKFIWKTASRSVQDFFIDDNELKSLKEEKVFSQKKKISQWLLIKSLY